MKYATVFLLLFSLLVGCSKAEPSSAINNKTVALSKTENDWRISPSFKVKDRNRPNGLVEMFGEEGKIGVIGSQLYANKVEKWMWHFWGEKSVLHSGKLKVVAINKETGEKVPILIEGTKAVWEYQGIAGPNNGADAHMPSNVSLPKAGIWRLDTYIGNKVFGNIIVEVK